MKEKYLDLFIIYPQNINQFALAVQTDMIDHYDNKQACNKSKFADISLIYDELLNEILGPSQAYLNQLGCVKCDVNRINKIIYIERFTVNLSLQGQLSFSVGIDLRGGWTLERSYTALFKYLNDFKEPARRSCIKIAKKLANLPLCAAELNYKIKIEHCLGNLVLYADWKSSHQSDIVLAEQKFGLLEPKYQPHLLCINPNSESTPLRLCSTSNTQMPTQIPKGELFDPTQIPKTLSYNCTMRKYSFNMNLSTFSNALQQSIIPAILSADISHAFLTIQKLAHVLINELEFYYLCSDNTPSFLKTDSNQEPQAFCRTHCSYGASDLPVIFNYIVKHAEQMYSTKYPSCTNTEITKF